MHRRFAALVLAGTTLNLATPVWSAVSGYNDAQVSGAYIRGWRVTASDDPVSDAFFHVSIGARIDPYSYTFYALGENTSWTYMYADIGYCMPGTHTFDGYSASTGAGHISHTQTQIPIFSMSQCC